MTSSRQFGQRFFVAVLVATLWGVPQLTHAQLGGVVSDPVTEAETGISAGENIAQTIFSGKDSVKEFALDPLAWMVAKIAIQSMTKSMVNWINSGFHGSPAFVGDLENHLQIVGDAAAYGFLNELTSNTKINSPFRNKLVKAAALGYYAATSKNAYFEVNTYTLPHYTTDDKAFLAGDFSKGGWRGWLWATANPQNNPYGAELAIGSELNARVVATKDSTKVQLNWGQGFMSWCGNVDPNKNGGGETDPEGNDLHVTALKTTDPSGCTQKNGKPGQTQTPGTVIQTQLNQTLGLTGNTLVSADEFDEIIGALMSQLVNQVVGGAGLRSVASVSSGGSGFIDQATDPAQLSTDGSGLASTLVGTISSQITQVTKYQTAWKKIGDEAILAKSALVGCAGATTASTTQVTNASDQADTASIKASAALSALQNIQTKANAASTASGSDSTSALTDIGTELQTLISGPTMPTATELAEAQSQSTDTSTNPNPSLYTQMKNIVEGCAIPI